MKRLSVYLITVWLIVSSQTTDEIEKIIADYYYSDIVHEFQNEWMRQKTSFDYALKLALKESYGRMQMNMFMPYAKDFFHVSHGFHVSDGYVNVLCYDMVLRALPNLIVPDIGLSLANNVLRLEATLTKMFLETNYILFRNQSDILDQGVTQDPYNMSPFTFQQVQKQGQMTIVAEDCILVGAVITRLNGPSLSLGHDTIRLADCKFSIEITTPGLGSPPVIAPYFSKEKGLELMSIMEKPIRETLVPKLQAALFSYINCTDILRNNLYKYRINQQKLFHATSEYFVNLVRQLNKITTDRNQGSEKLSNFEISTAELINGKLQTSKWALTNLVLYGLDTAYSSNSGGPYKLRSIRVSEGINFNNIQVRGKLLYENESYSEVHDFYAELKDVLTDVTLAIDMLQKGEKRINTRFSLQRFSVTRWRSMDFSMINLDKHPKMRSISYALINGYLSNMLPKILVQYFSSTFMTAFKIEADHTFSSSSETEVKELDKPVVKNETLSAENIEDPAEDSKTNNNSADTNYINGNENDDEKEILQGVDQQASENLQNRKQIRKHSKRNMQSKKILLLRTYEIKDKNNIKESKKTIKKQRKK